jgi:P4 family phage/plasmid primase-like protien
MARAGIPIFVAPPNPNHPVGFNLPTAWQQTIPDPAVVDRWEPGMALCAVMGKGLDLLDVDPRNDGDLSFLDGMIPLSYGVASTPSGGFHSFVKSMNCGSRDNVFPGIDVKSGLPDGSSRGFAFLAPTVRKSKEDGQFYPYRWMQAPDLVKLAEYGPQDTSNEALAAKVREVRLNAGGSIGSKFDVPDHDPKDQWWFDFISYREPQSQVSAERAITNKLLEIKEFDPQSGAGFRQVLLRAAFTLGGYVGGEYLDETDARERLEDAVTEVWPDGPDEQDQLWIDQGLKDGAKGKFTVYTPEDELRWAKAAKREFDGDMGEDPEDPTWTVYSAIGLHPFDPSADRTDQGLAEQVALRMLPALRYGTDSDTWLVRGSNVWRETKDMADWATSQVARLMPPGDPDFPKSASDYTAENWQAKTRARFLTSGPSGAIERKLKSIVKDTGHPGGIEVGRLDTNPEILWAGGQAWDLRASGDVPVPARIDLATPHLRSALCLPAPIETPAWDAFVATVFPDPEVRAWAMRVLSIALAGYPDAAIPVLYGPERTGKTALISLMVKVLGSYGHAADPRLLAGADNAHASVVYALKGRRLSFIDEGPRKGHLAAERLKQLTGGGQLTGNAMRANPVTFDPTHTLVMTTNDEPPITDPALRARMRIIPCEADRDLVRAARQTLTPAVWTQEAPGVLAKLMRECAAWLANPDTALTSSAPFTLQTTMDDMVSGQDPIVEWVAEMCIHNEHGTSGRVLHRAFLAWHEMQPAYKRSPAPSETMFGRTLGKLGYDAIRNAGPKKNQVYRPLIISGGGGLFNPGFTPAPNSASSPTVGPLVPVGSSEEQSEPKNTRSGPVFSSSSDSQIVSSSTINYSTQNNTTHKREESREVGNREVASEVAEVDQKTGPEQPKQAPVGSSPVVPEPTNPRKTPFGDLELPDDYDPLKPINAYQVAVWADRRRISKTDARAELKAIKAQAKLEERREAKLAKLHDAEGRKVALPAGCDRDGNVIELTLTQAATAVRQAMRRTGVGVLTVDVETSGYPIGHRDYKLRTVQLGDDQIAVTFDPAKADQAELIRELLSEAAYLQAHSATADLAPLASAHLIDHDSGWERMHDTALKAKLADPASTGADPGLKKLGEKVLGPRATAAPADTARASMFAAGGWLKETEVTTPVERSGWAQADSGTETMVRYASSDVLDTAAIAKELPGIPDEIMARERLVQIMTAKLPLYGVRLDYEHVKAMQAKHRPLRDEAAAAVLSMAPSIENPGSPKQVAEALTARGIDLRDRKGKISAAKEVLEPLQFHEEVGPLVKKILEYRHNNTVINMFMEPYRVLCEHGDGRARPTVYTLGTNTGRMSCVRPNLQQLSRQGGVRACITADPGQLMIGADFSGVELRVAAALSQDENLKAIIAAGRDIHEEIARQVWGDNAEASKVSESNPTGRPKPAKEHRYVAKRLVFGRLYGGGVEALAAQTGTSLEAAQAVINTLDGMTPQLSAWSNNVRNAVKNGQSHFQAYSGRLIHFDTLRPHSAPNYAIQGTARELLVDALVKWRKTRWGNSVLLPVHDELDVFVPEADAEQATWTLIECMATTFQGVEIVAEPSAPSFAWQDSS